MRKYLRTLAVSGALVALGVAACGSPPPEAEAEGKEKASPTAGKGTGNKDFKACMVSDSGGFDDKSFNQTSFKGLEDAVKDLGIQQASLESKSNNDYPTNINTMVDQKCNVIVTVGFLLGDATYSAAKANPDVDFVIVDYGFDPAKQPALPNLQSLLFNTAQPSFMAGYLAAGMTKSGKVGTFGGAKIPTVEIFMDGYWEGVQYYNAQKKKNVAVVGWNAAKADGSFVKSDKPFEDKLEGQNVANNLISQGADVIFPVAGPAGLGGLQAAQGTGGKVSAIWVDTDGCLSAANYCPALLSSAVKAMDLAVQTSITAAHDDKFSNVPYVGTLENNGVSLAPYHDFDAKIPAGLKSEIDQIKADLISGKLQIKSKFQPK